MASAIFTGSKKSAFLSVFQIAEWLPQYKLNLFKWDLFAGITLASFVLPESMAYATLAGLPPVLGIYCCLTGGLLFALFTSSRQVAVGPTSAISLMVGTSVAALSGGDPSRWVAIASLTALAVFFLCYFAYFLRLSSLVSFISENILLGFKAGAALAIASTQLPALFGIVGIKGGEMDFFERIANIINHLSETNLYVLLFGIGVIVLLQLGRWLFPGRPVALIIVVLTIILFTFTSLAQHGFRLTGEIQQGLPPFQRPSLRYSDLHGILPLALGCFLMAYIETITSARAFSRKNNYTINPHQELLSLGTANLGAAFTSGYPVSGGLSQSTVNDKAGAKTPMALIICSAALALLLLYFTGLLKNLPEVLLAVIVIDAVLSLIKIKALKRLYFLSKTEFGIAIIAIISVLVFGILQGVLIAAISSIGFVIIRSKSPNIAVLGQIPGTDKYSDIKRNPDNVEVKGIRIFRVESSILYYNEAHVHAMIGERIEPDKKNLGLVIIDLSASPYIDVAGADMLLDLSKELAASGIQLKIVESIGVVRDMLRKLGMEELIGHISRKDSIHQEVEFFLENQPSSELFIDPD